MEISERIAELLIKRKLGQLTLSEWAELAEYSSLESYRGIMLSYIEKEWNASAVGEVENELLLAEQTANDVLKEIRARTSVETGRVRRVPVHRWWIAASVLLLLAAGAYWLFWPVNKHVETIAETKLQHDALPGKQGAVLTLSDGRKVMLDSLANGHIAEQNGATISLADGKLLYAPNDAGKTTLQYNTMTTPRGRKFQMTLPDGTQVWLNAESSITYPTVFNEKERIVSISGEAYFEVAQNKKQPFYVKASDGIQIQVLGTSFNVNAYANEPDIRTTLLSGAVKVSHNGNVQMLSPGQQLQLKGGKFRLIQHADTDHAVAWKNGFFSFNDADLPTMMRQLARWYNVEVVFEGKIPEYAFNGEIDQSLSLDELMLSLSKKLHYKIENGNKITILP